MITAAEIAKFIEHDRLSRKKNLARLGQRYYEADHDIRGYRIFFFDADGQMKEDKTKSNIKISHPFFTEIVDQLVQYVLSGNGRFVKSDDPRLQAHLDDYFNENEDFVEELSALLTGAQVKGFDYLYAFKDENGKTRFQWADSIGVVECPGKYTSDGKDYVIYWYVDRIDQSGNRIENIRLYDDERITFFCRVNDGEMVPDSTVPLNPRPHSVYHLEGSGEQYGESYGFIPFFRLDNCKKQFSALKPIKDLIDDYDLMNAGLSNNIQDTNEALYVVKGFQGDNLDELMNNLRSKKHIGVDDSGGVEIHTVDIPTEARRVKMEVDEKNIYRFGMALNTAGLKDTSATTNLAIKAAYSLLDLRANKLKKSLRQFLRRLLRIVLEEINQFEGTNYQQRDVYFDFGPEIPTNAQENAQIALLEAQRRSAEITTILNLAGTIDNETRLQLICEQLDIDYQGIKDKLPKPEPSTAAAKAALADAVPDGD